MAKLLEVLRLLENGIPIPAELKPHRLTGNYADCMECHIELPCSPISEEEKKEVEEEHHGAHNYKAIIPL